MRWVEYTQTDLISLKRADRTSLREAANVAVVMYPVPEFFQGAD